MNTREARAVVPATFSLQDVVFQSAQIAALVAGLTLNDYALISRAMEDRVAEPYRAALLPGFAQGKAAAMTAGALGASLSGSGPTSFALARGDKSAARIAGAMAAAYNSVGVECSVRVARIGRGAYTE
jgi:homoserine kinase